MRKQLWILLAIVILYCCACGTGNGNATGESTTTPSLVFSTRSQTATPLQTSSPTPGKLITATVWSKDPVVPILLYHQFAADIAPASTSVKVRFSDFRQQLEDLYASGYSLVSFEKWVAGGLEVPLGRHPLIFSMDDLFFNNQIALLDDGTPSPETGIGILWQFYQEHPDFGFHAILFANLGDKLYANPDKPDWQDKLARAIVWCIDHDALVYNHTYLHVRLDLSNASEIKSELFQNDDYLRKLLLRAGRPDLIPRLSNYFALPYGIWPTTYAGIDAIKNYTNPEGKPMLGIFEAGFDTTKLLPPPYSANFDRWHIPRFAATLSSIHTLVQQSSQMPTTTTCDLDSGSGDSAFLGDQIYLAIQNNRCPVGIYVTDQFIFDATQPADVKLIFTRMDYSAP